MTQLSNAPPAKILSRSPVIALLLQRVQQVADTDIQVLMLGETGVGKDLLAQTIHHQSARGAEDFQAVNCAALPANLVESELFGYEKGAFTGATERHAGYFEQAHGSTLFLDEIGDMPMNAQRTLLRVLEQNRLTRVGGRASIPIDVRIIAATNRDLQRAIKEGTFREDLYYRLSGLLLTVPPLRERPEDIPLLAEDFVRQYAHEYQRPMRTLSDEVLAYLQAYAWPGNVRQLKQWVRGRWSCARGSAWRWRMCGRQPMWGWFCRWLRRLRTSRRYVQDAVGTPGYGLQRRLRSPKLSRRWPRTKPKSSAL